MFLGFGLDAWITIVTLVLVIFALVRTRLRADLVFLSAVGVLFVTGVLPLLKSVFIAAGAMLAFDCSSPSQAMNAINWRLLLSIGGGITLGTALQTTGVAHQVAMGILDICGDHPLMVMIAFCLMGAVIIGLTCPIGLVAMVPYGKTFD